MTRLGPFVALALLPGAPLAQHPPAVFRSASVIETPGVAGCRMCHMPHRAVAGSANLRGNPTGAPAAATSANGGVPGPSSQICLSCHSTSQQRARMPGMSATSRAGTYMGSSLRDDHPLGIVSRPALPRRGASEVGPLSGRARSNDRSSTIECSTCHDPHDRFTGTPDTFRLQQICMSCHNDGTYAGNAHAEFSCSDCHALHGSTEVDLLNSGGSNALCASCHSVGSDHETAYSAADTPQTNDPRIRVRLSRSSCASCHSIHG